MNELDNNLRFAKIRTLLNLGNKEEAVQVIINYLGNNTKWNREHWRFYDTLDGADFFGLNDLKEKISLATFCS